MRPDTQLAGFARLIDVCQRHLLLLKLAPPLSTAPRAGDVVLGEAIDPQLTAVFERVGAAEFGSLSLYSPGSNHMDFIPWNERLKKHETTPYQFSLVFGEETGFPLYYGTVARLADAFGCQPVVHINGYEAYAVPVASSVDRFFDAYSRYLEIVAEQPEPIHPEVTSISFPWAMTSLIARDEALMKLVRAGRFDFLTNDFRDAVEWIQELRDAKP